MTKKNPRPRPSAPLRRKAAIPLVWKLACWFSLTLLGLLLYPFMLHLQGVPMLPRSGESTDPHFFAALVAVLVPCLLQGFLFLILRGIIQRRSALDISLDVGKDLAKTGCAIAGSVLLDSITNSSGGGSSHGGTDDTSSGSGGSFGGGGASGGY